MKLPNWFRVSWWVLVTALVTWVLGERYPDLVAGRAAPVDVFIFAVWVALMLAPLFQELSFLGVKFKQEIDDLKSFLAVEIGDIRNDVRNAVDVRTTISPQITFPAPAPDSQLPELEERIKGAVADALSARGSKSRGTITPPVREIPEDVTFLFTSRYAIEKELRWIASTRGLEFSRMPINRLATALTQAEVIERNLANAVREVYAICSPAIHGEPVTKSQVTFVRDVAPELIAALQSIP